MTPEEAYKILNGEIIYKGGRTNGKRFAMGELNRVINEALEKQIPKKPFYYKDIPHCSKCKYDINAGADYCRKCGQAIDWGE